MKVREFVYTTLVVLMYLDGLDVNSRKASAPKPTVSYYNPEISAMPLLFSLVK